MINPQTTEAETLHIEARGFPTRLIHQQLSLWPRVPSEYKMQVLAESIFSHYQKHHDYMENLSYMVREFRYKDKTSAVCRFGKILSAWLHQKWPELPCSNLPREEAFKYFPEHALRVPSETLNLVFQSKYITLNSDPEKFLDRPTDWKGSLDAFLKILDSFREAPKRVTVIGFETGDELHAMHSMWPESEIHAYESPLCSVKLNSDVAAQPKISLFYNGDPASYKHGKEEVDFILIRHPDTMGHTSWIDVVEKAAESLKINGSLLLTFYSRSELLVLKNFFIRKRLFLKYEWYDCLNPWAYNPSFLCKKSANSFDFYMATIFLGERPEYTRLKSTEMRRKEPMLIDPYPSLRKFCVIKDDAAIDIVRSDYIKNYKTIKNVCFICKKALQSFYMTRIRIGGEKNMQGVIVFCKTHIPADEIELKIVIEKILSLKNPVVCQYDLVGQRLLAL